MAFVGVRHAHRHRQRDQLGHALRQGMLERVGELLEGEQRVGTFAAHWKNSPR
jgi:hypothetical protein